MMLLMITGSYDRSTRNTKIKQSTHVREVAFASKEKRGSLKSKQKSSTFSQNDLKINGKQLKFAALAQNISRRLHGSV